MTKEIKNENIEHQEDNTLTKEEVLENEIKDLKEQIKELKKERMVARRRATKAEKEEEEAIEEIKRKLELEEKKSEYYFRKMRQSRNELEEVISGLEGNLKLTANMLSNTHQTLLMSLNKVNKARVNTSTPTPSFSVDMNEEE